MRLIDADALIENHFSDGHRISMSYADKAWMRSIIRNEPTIDAVPVVRCRKCKHWETDWPPSGFDPDNPRYFCSVNDIFPTGDWFCKDGQRREEGRR